MCTVKTLDGSWFWHCPKRKRRRRISEIYLQFCVRIHITLFASEDWTVSYAPICAASTFIHVSICAGIGMNTQTFDCNITGVGLMAIVYCKPHGCGA